MKVCMGAVFCGLLCVLGQYVFPSVQVTSTVFIAAILSVEGDVHQDKNSGFFCQYWKHQCHFIKGRQDGISSCVHDLNS